MALRQLKDQEHETSEKQKVPLSATAKMRRRTGVAGAILMAFCIAAAGKLFKVSVADNAKYEALANNYHFGTMTLDANRGAIYDANGTALAWSATVYNVYIDPKLYREEMDSIAQSNQNRRIRPAKTVKKPPIWWTLTSCTIRLSPSCPESWKLMRRKSKILSRRTIGITCFRLRWKRMWQMRSQPILIS